MSLSRMELIAAAVVIANTTHLQVVLWSDWILWLRDGQGGGSEFGTKLKIAGMTLVDPCWRALCQASPGQSFRADKDQLVSLWRPIPGANVFHLRSPDGELFLLFACRCSSCENRATAHQGRCTSNRPGYL